MSSASRWIGNGLAGIACMVGATASQPKTARAEQLSVEQSRILEWLERGALHVLQDGEHVPVYALVILPSGEMQMIDLEEGYARQEHALAEIYARLILMARDRQIVASGIVFQPGDAGKEKLNILGFELEQEGHPRFLIVMPYERNRDGISIGEKIIDVEKPRLFKR